MATLQKSSIACFGIYSVVDGTGSARGGLYPNNGPIIPDPTTKWVAIPYQTSSPLTGTTPVPGGATIAQLQAGVDNNISSPISPSVVTVSNPSPTATATLTLTAATWASQNGLPLILPIQITGTYVYNGVTTTRSGLSYLTIKKP